MASKDVKRERSVINEEEIEDRNYNALSELFCPSGFMEVSEAAMVPSCKKRKLDTAQEPCPEDDYSVFQLLYKKALKEQHGIIADSLIARYNRRSDVKTADGWPYSYRYLSENEDGSLVQYDSVMTNEAPTVQDYIVGKEGMTIWKKLQPKYLDRLYIVLCLPVLLYESLVYDDKLQRWHRDACKADARETACLTLYGTEDEKYMTTFLRRGRSQQEMYEAIRDEHSLKLYWRWVRALKQKMTDCVGRTAVADLMDAIIDLLNGLQASFPVVELTHVSSSTPENCSKMASSASSESSSKRLSGCEKQLKTDGEGHEEDKVKSLEGNGQDVDLFVASYDKTSDVAKYSFLIKIHGENFDDAANKKFCREVIHVLQSQAEVYGLFFSLKRARLYRATRISSGEIFIYYKNYNIAIPVEPLSPKFVVDVEVFQNFIMDIFTCLVQSIFIAV